MEVQVVSPGQQPAQVAAPSAAAADHSVPPIPAAPASEAQPHDAGALSPVVAKIFGHSSGSATHSVSVNVSYRVEHDPNMIVTVFTDPTTGQEIAQVPAETLVQIAQFFDKESGVTLDRSA